MRTLAVAILFSLSASAAESPRGILVTNVTVGADYVDVAWAADVPPPYRAAIHVPRAAWLLRDTPVEYVDTDACSARIPLDIGPASVFVQVYSPDDPEICRPDPSRMLRTEWGIYCRKEAARPLSTIADLRQRPRLASDGRIETDALPWPVTLESNGSGAVGWIPTDATGLSFRVVSALESGPRGQTTPVTNEVTVSRTHASTRCPGIRVSRSSVPGGFVIGVEESCSARPNMSQAVLIRRGYATPFSAETTWRDSTNWFSTGVLVPVAAEPPYSAYPYGGAALNTPNTP